MSNIKVVGADDDSYQWSTVLLVVQNKREEVSIMKEKSRENYDLRSKKQRSSSHESRDTKARLNIDLSNINQWRCRPLISCILSPILFDLICIKTAPGQYAHHVFRTMDKTKSGKITFKEFLIWLSDVSRGDTLDKLAWTFKLYDVNEDGLITRSDLGPVIQSVFLLMGKKKEAEDDELINSKVDAFFQVRLLYGITTEGSRKLLYWIASLSVL